MAFDERLHIVKGSEVRLNSNDYMDSGFRLGDLLKVEYLHDEENKAVLFRSRHDHNAPRITVMLDQISIVP